MESVIFGWDIGGAHLKMAVVNPAGRVISASQYPAPLWQGLDILHSSLRQAFHTSRLPGMRHVVTTTAELVDIFQDRRQGIQALADCLLQVLDSKAVQFYGGGADWIQPEFAASHYQRIASANWHATASYAASVVNAGILLDIGSTTTDIIAFHNGKVCNTGYTDFERLASGELVYTGICRTPVMAETDTVMLNGRQHPLVAEVFATMADVYRVLGRLDENDDMLPAADGAGKSRLDSIRRLARMTGRDATGDSSGYDWQQVAADIAECQKDRITRGVIKVLAGIKGSGELTIVGAGAGRFLAEHISAGLGLPYRDFADLLDAPGNMRSAAARSAPAVSVALLARAAA